MNLFKILFNNEDAASAEKPAKKADNTVEETVNVTEEVQEDEEELIAVFTAAIVASLGSGIQGNLIVRSFRRIPTVSPVWNMTGRKELLERKL